MSVVMHVDMDAFYASVELRRHPELVDLPMWVGGHHRGVVLSANYVARGFGVSGGMAVGRARRLCPSGVGIAPDFEAYAAVSDGVKQILDSVAAEVDMVSIDEAYVRLAPRRDRQAPAELGQRVRALVHDEQGIACSVGLGPNRLIAKMASVAAKPDGLVEVPAAEVARFLAPLPVERLVGVGESIASRLRRLGVETIEDLGAMPLTSLRQIFGPQLGATLAALARGDDVRHHSRAGERGFGCQETFWDDQIEPAAIRAELLRVCATVARRMRAAQVLGRTVTIRLRHADFVERSASVTLPGPTDSTGELYEVAARLLGRLASGRVAVRRVGVRVTDVVPRSRAWLQPSLDGADQQWELAERAVDQLNQAYGPRAVRRGRLAGVHRGVSI